MSVDGDTNGDGKVDFKDVVGVGVRTPPPAGGNPLDGFLGSLTPKPPAAPPPPKPAPPPPVKKPPAGGGGSGNGAGGRGGAGTAANADQTAGGAVDASAANSQNGFNNSAANLDALRSEIERLGPILDTPEGQQQLMAALQRYLQAGGGQLQATDGAAQQQAGDLKGLLDQLQPDGKKPNSDKDRDDKDEDKDSDSKDSKSDSSDLKDLLSSLGPALQSLNPLGQQSPLSQLGQQSPFGQQGGQSPFGQNSPFGPNGTPAGAGVTPAANPFGSVPGATPAGSPAGGGSTGGTPGSPFDALKTEAEKQAEGANGGEGDGKDDPNSKTVTMPDGSKVEAPTLEAAQALRASVSSDDATAAYQAAHVDIKTNPGTLVDPAEVRPGDYARWEDGQMSVAAGPGRVINNGQVVDVNTIATDDQGFEGWYRPDGDAGGGQVPKTPATASSDK